MHFCHHMCSHPYQSCRCNLLEPWLMLQCQGCFHGYTEIQSQPLLLLVRNSNMQGMVVMMVVVGLQDQHYNEENAPSYQRGSHNVSFYSGNFRLPICQSTGSGSHRGVMHISFRGEDFLLHNV